MGPSRFDEMAQFFYIEHEDMVCIRCSLNFKQYSDLPHKKVTSVRFNKRYLMGSGKVVCPSFWWGGWKRRHGIKSGGATIE